LLSLNANVIHAVADRNAVAMHMPNAAITQDTMYMKYKQAVTLLK